MEEGKEERKKERKFRIKFEKKILKSNFFSLYQIETKGSACGGGGGGGVGLGLVCCEKYKRKLVS